MEWISVKDRLPELDTDVLISSKIDQWVSIGYCSHSEKNIWYDSTDCSMRHVYPTHWAEKPEPPKQ